MGVLRRPGRQLLDAAVRERREVVGCAGERGERDPPGLVGQRHMHLGAPGERLEQRPLGAGEVLEAVGEDRLTVPGVELGLKALGGTAAQEVAVPEAEPVELRAIGGVELGEVAAEVARVEHSLLELAERLEQRVGEPVRAGGARQAVQRRRGERASHDQRSLRVRRNGTLLGIDAAEAPEEVVERPDRAAEEAAAATEQVALDAVDVRRVRHDQCRFVVEARQIALQKKRDFARMRRPREEGQPHLPIVERPQDVSPGRSRRKRRSKRARRPSAGGHAARPRGPACSLHSRRRGRPPWSRGAHRRRSRGASPRAPHRPPSRSCRKREWFSVPISPPELVFWPQFTQPNAQREFARTGADSMSQALPDRVPYLERQRPANVGAENPRSFCRRDTAPQLQD